MASDKNGGPNFVQEWREHRGLTREQLAAVLDTSPTMVWSLESGERGLSAKWLRRLSKALDATPGDLLDHSPSTASSNVRHIWEVADTRERRQIVAMAEAVIGLRRGTND